MQLVGNWNYPTRVWIGPGRIAELGAACTVAGINRPLLVTDAVLAGLPMISAAQAALAKDGKPAGLFCDVRGNPVEGNVYRGVDALRAGNHDGVIAFGGGSALDVGKVIAFMAGQRRPMWDFEDIGDWWTRAEGDAILPIVAVPTTAGTGSEVGRAGVITHSDSHTKKVIFHPRMLPAVALCDPELTLGLPPGITAATGIDAFIHCLEAYCAPGYHPLAEGIAVEGMRLVHDHLPRAVADGSDLEARTQMMAAATMGATAFQKGLGGVHALAHAVGALYDTHHGLTNGVILPYVLIHNRAAIDSKIDRLARWLGLAPGFDGFLDFVLRLRRTIGIPERLEQLGVDTDRAERVAAMALADPTASGNPIPLDAVMLERLFRAAVRGDLDDCQSAGALAAG
jgi:alcohol dehydrogenase class IV